LLLPVLIVGLSVLLSIPLGRYLARVLDRGGARNAFERLIDTGPQTWKQYCSAMLVSNGLMFLFAYMVLATQPWHPAFLNPDGKGMLSPTTIFNTACSFLTNTNLQHYSGEVHLTYGSQLFAILLKQMLTPAVGLAALLAVTRGLRGDTHLGNYNLDLWRGLVYVALPLSLVVGVVLVLSGVPMTFLGNLTITTVEGGEQVIARGPVAAVVAIKQLGTNGGGFFGPNSAHPFENPTGLSNVVECACILLVPMACVVMFGVMLRNLPHARVVFAVMLAYLVGLTAWGIATDSARPNPAFADRARLVDANGNSYRVAAVDADGNVVEKELDVPARVGLPVDQPAGNQEGQELRFGRGATATWAAATTCTSNGSVNGMHDSLKPSRRSHPARGHVAQLRLRRRRRRAHQLPDLPDPGRVPGRADGRPHARVPRQEGGGPRDEAGGAGPARAPAAGAGADRAVRRARLGRRRHEQPRPARVHRNPVRVQLREREQRLRVRGGSATATALTTPRRTRARPLPTSRTGTSRRRW